MRKRIMGFVMILVLFLSACAGEKKQQDNVLQSSEVKTEEMHYKLQETKLPDGNEALIHTDSSETRPPEDILYGIDDGNIYRVVYIYGDGYDIVETCIQRLGSPYEKWNNTFIRGDEWGVDTFCYPKIASLHSDGSIHMLLQGKDADGKSSYYVTKWTASSGCSTVQVSGEWLDNDFFSGVRSGYVDCDGISFFVTKDGVQYFDSSFSEKNLWLNTGYVWQFAEGMTEKANTGKDILLCGTALDGGFCVWEIESQQPVFAFEEVEMTSASRVVFDDGKEGYLCTESGIWKGNMEEGLEQQLSFPDCGYYLERIVDISVGEDGILRLVVIVDGEYLLLERIIDENWMDKKELELAVLWADSFLKKAVADFNRHSEDCVIVLREPEEGEDINDYITRIQVEVGSGQGPALLANHTIDLQNAAERGMLRELTEDFSEEKDKMLDNVWDCGKVDGACYAISYSFQVETLVVSSDVVGDKTSWTAEELMQYVKTNGAQTAISIYDSSNLFWTLVSSGKLIDWEQGKSYLDGEEAVRLLEFAQEYGEKGSPDDAGIRIVEGNTLAGYASLWGLNSNLGHVHEVMFEGKEVYIGFPVEQSSVGSGNILLGRTLAVNQACEYPEEAIGFIKYLLGEDNQDWLAKNTVENTMSGFPVTKKALEDAFRYADEKQSEEFYGPGILISYNGFEYTPGPISAEGLDKIYKALQVARPQETYMEGVARIVYEEAPAYFSGSKTAREVCDVMQNRVQLYLDEIR